jgi:hypothetical protein
MTSRETEICVKLLTGEPPKIRVARIPHRDVQAILIPRGKLSQAVQHQAWNRLAVYLLLGKSEKEAISALYIGRTDTAWERLKNHNYKKDFWDVAIVVVSKTNDGFSHDDIHWLEWRCIQKAQEINRFKLFSDHKPDAPHSTKPGMSELFDALCLLVSTLGYPVFEPEEDIDTPPSAQATSLPLSPAEVFYCRVKDADATGAFIQDGFVVRQGSIARLPIASASVKAIEPIRKKLLDTKILVEDKGRLRFTQDHVFKSPSGAAAIVLGRSADGWMEWKNKEGKPLDEIMRASAPKDVANS